MTTEQITRRGGWLVDVDDRQPAAWREGERAVRLVAADDVDLVAYPGDCMAVAGGVGWCVREESPCVGFGVVGRTVAADGSGPVGAGDLVVGVTR